MKKITLLAASFALLSLSSCGGNRTLTGAESYKAYGEKVEDRTIITKVRHSFKMSPAIPNDLIHLSVDRGVLQLSGFVHSHKDADLAILTASKTPGVAHVINDLIVMSSEKYAHIRATAASGTASR